MNGEYPCAGRGPVPEKSGQTGTYDFMLLTLLSRLTSAAEHVPPMSKRGCAVRLPSGRRGVRAVGNVRVRSAGDQPSAGQGRSRGALPGSSSSSVLGAPQPGPPVRSSRRSWRSPERRGRSNVLRAAGGLAATPTDEPRRSAAGRGRGIRTPTSARAWGL